jgi:hypothetical protein
MSLSTTPADVLLQLAAGLTQLQEVSLCYGEMADAAAAAAGWSALPLRSLVSAMTPAVHLNLNSVRGCWLELLRTCTLTLMQITCVGARISVPVCTHMHHMHTCLVV